MIHGPFCNPAMFLQGLLDHGSSLLALDLLTCLQALQQLSFFRFQDRQLASPTPSPPEGRDPDRLRRRPFSSCRPCLRLRVGQGGLALSDAPLHLGPALLQASLQSTEQRHKRDTPGSCCGCDWSLPSWLGPALRKGLDLGSRLSQSLDFALRATHTCSRIANSRPGAGSGQLPLVRAITTVADPIADA